MKYIQLFEDFSGTVNNLEITIKVFNQDTMYDIIYNNDSLPNVQDLDKRIKYFHYNDVSKWGNDSKAKNLYFVMYHDDYIIGISQLGWNEYATDTNTYWISYTSIDHKYQGRGLSKILLEEVYKYASEHNISLEGSRYSDRGREVFPKYHEYFSKKYNVSYTRDSN